MTPMPTTPTSIMIARDHSGARGGGQVTVLECRARGSWMPPASPLKAPLERLYREADLAARTGRDAIRYPLRYPEPADREVVALLSACMAYGRVDLFGPWVEWALER